MCFIWIIFFHNPSWIILHNYSEKSSQFNKYSQPYRVLLPRPPLNCWREEGSPSADPVQAALGWEIPYPVYLFTYIHICIIYYVYIHMYVYTYIYTYIHMCIYI
jgi:hypothetical protein